MNINGVALRMGFLLSVGLSSSLVFAHKNNLDTQSESPSIQPLQLLNGYDDIKAYLLSFLSDNDVFQAILVKEFNKSATKLLNERHVGKYQLIRELSFDRIFRNFLSTQDRFVIVDDRAVQVWDSKTSQPIAFFQFNELVHVYDISSNGTRVFIALNDGTSKVWDVGTGEHIDLNLDSRSIRSSLFSADGDKIFIEMEVEVENQVEIHSESDEEREYVPPSRFGQIWDLKKDQLPVLKWEKKDISVVAFSPDGKRAITLRQGSSRAELLDADTGARIASVNVGSDITFIAFSDGGKKLVLTTAMINGIQICHGESGVFITSIEQSQNEWIASADLLPDGKRIITRDYARGFKIWDLETGLLCAALNTENRQTSMDCFSSDGKRVATRTVRIDCADNDIRIDASTIINGTRLVRADSSVICTNTNIWEVETGKLVTTLKDRCFAGIDYFGRLVDSHERLVVFCLTDDGKIMTRTGNSIGSWEFKKNKDIDDIKKEISQKRWHVTPLAIILDRYFEELPAELPGDMQF